MNYYYNFAFVKAETNKNNPDIIDIYYGCKKIPYHIHKDRAFDFLCATLPYSELFWDRTIDILKAHAQKNPIKLLNECLKGMPIIFVTKLGSYNEYIEDGQNAIVGVTSMNIKGNMNDIFLDDVSNEEFSPKNNEKISPKNDSESEEKNNDNPYIDLE